MSGSLLEVYNIMQCQQFKDGYSRSGGGGGSSPLRLLDRATPLTSSATQSIYKVHFALQHRLQEITSPQGPQLPTRLTSPTSSSSRSKLSLSPLASASCTSKKKEEIDGGSQHRCNCSSWIFCTIYVCIPNVSLVVETASPLHACTVTVPCTHLLFSPLKSFSTSVVSPFHTL